MSAVRNRRIARKVADLLESDVRDRRGLRQEFDQFDDDVVREIRRAWRAIVERVLREEEGV